MNINISDNKKNFAQLYLFELIERITRFYNHLNSIEAQFYSEDRPLVGDKSLFIHSYKDCLLKMLEIAFSITKFLQKKDLRPSDIDPLILKIKEIVGSIYELHKNYLSHLPRPSEPIELRRFTRIIDKQLLNLRKSSDQSIENKQISIFVSDEIGEETFKLDPLTKFKDSQMNSIINSFNDLAQKIDIDAIPNLEISTEGDQKTVHITIPRIDDSNPCRWATLAHEVAHHVMDNHFFQEGDIEKDFGASLEPEQLSALKGLNDKISIESWLTECWCDLFACVVIGPAFWFSQYATFIFVNSSENNTVNETHPPALFRLNLIYKILSHRFSETLFEELKKAISISESLLDYFDKQNTHGFNHDDDIRELFLWFKNYFFKYFFAEKDSKLIISNTFLNEKLQPLVKYTDKIKGNTIKNLVKFLEMGLPIPSVRFNSSNTYKEIPATVQEILLAAWLYRNNEFKNVVIKKFDELSLNIDLNKKNEFVKTYEDSIINLFTRFDQSILRSIQVGEWFHIYHDEATKEEKNDIIPKNSKVYRPRNLLIDKEIVELIKSNKLRIIPIMNLEDQLGSSSFDIRLGTSFQLYFPNKSGLVDFIDESTIYNADKSSTFIDLDFLESITISQGQFLLGHSMEYFKFPENISAEIEGRSSFARLGLEIHMTAGFVDPGFEGVLTFELLNAGPNPIRLFPGIRIAQLRFIPVNRPQKSYSKKPSAKYKGLLAPNISLQLKDPEVDKIRNELKKIKRDNI